MTPHCPDHLRIDSLVPMAHAKDVDESIEFYGRLGFECRSRFSSPHGGTNWAEMLSRKARLFLARADGPIDPSIQAVLFYMYCADVVGLRTHLLSNGCTDAGPSPSALSARGERCPPGVPLKAVYETDHPFYMPHGELRVHDPDGYVILVGQLGSTHLEPCP